MQMARRRRRKIPARRVQAAMSAFPWSLGVHISAISLGDATFLAMSELPLLYPVTKVAVRRGRGLDAAFRRGQYGRMRQVDGGSDTTTSRNDAGGDCCGEAWPE